MKQSTKIRENYGRIYEKFSIEEVGNTLFDIVQDVNEICLYQSDDPDVRLSILYEGLKKFGIIDSSINRNNETFDFISILSKKDKSDNPYIITSERLKKEFLYNADETIIEKYAKNLFWENRLAKLCNQHKYEILKKSSSNKNKYEYLYKSFLKNVDIEEFILSEDSDKYSQCISDFFHNSENLKKESADIKEFKQYAISEYCSNKFYELKSMDIKNVIEEYANIKDTQYGKSIYICKYKDDSKRLSCFNNVFQITFPNYTAPISVHENEKFLKDLERKNNVELNVTKLEYPIKPIISYRMSLDEKRLMMQFTRKALNNTKKVKGEKEKVKILKDLKEFLYQGDLRENRALKEVSIKRTCKEIDEVDREIRKLQKNQKKRNNFKRKKESGRFL